MLGDNACSIIINFEFLKSFINSTKRKNTKKLYKIFKEYISYDKSLYNT